MSFIYLWTDTDLQVPTAGMSAPPVEDWYQPPVVSLVQPFTPMLWLYDQNDLPQLQAMDDDGWTMVLTVGTPILVRPDPSAWANDELPTPPAVTPNEDWNVLQLIGLPVVVPAPVRPAEYLWHPDEHPTIPVTIFPSDDSILPLMRVIPFPIQLPSPAMWEQDDWWGGGSPAVNKSHRGALRMGLGLRIR